MAVAVAEAWMAMVSIVRNAGRPGIAATAISAVDVALWDLKARALDVPLVSLGPVRERCPSTGAEASPRIRGTPGLLPQDQDARRLRAQSFLLGEFLARRVGAALIISGALATVRRNAA